MQVNLNKRKMLIVDSQSVASTAYTDIMSFTERDILVKYTGNKIKKVCNEIWEMIEACPIKKYSFEIEDVIDNKSGVKHLLNYVNSMLASFDKDELLDFEYTLRTLRPDYFTKWASFLKDTYGIVLNIEVPSKIYPCKKGEDMVTYLRKGIIMKSFTDIFTLIGVYKRHPDVRSYGFKRRFLEKVSDNENFMEICIQHIEEWIRVNNREEVVPLRTKTNLERFKDMSLSVFLKSIATQYTDEYIDLFLKVDTETAGIFSEEYEAKLAEELKQVNPKMLIRNVIIDIEKYTSKWEYINMTYNKNYAPLAI